MILLKRIGELLFPPKCVLCRKLLEKEELDLCRHCRTHVAECGTSRRKIPYLDSRTVVWYYENDVRGSLIRYKFHRARHYANSYGRLLAMKLLREGKHDVDLVTWVPVSKRRKFSRGYDQVELLGRALCKELDLPFVPCLKKIRHNATQSTIKGEAQRRANVMGVYRSVNGSQFAGKRILLLDDIITTGATISECAKILKIAGAKEVHGAAIAATRQNK